MASGLRDGIQHLAAALAETEARLADLATIRKVVAELAPAGGQPAPPETNTATVVATGAARAGPGLCARWSAGALGEAAARLDGGVDAVAADAELSPGSCRLSHDDQVAGLDRSDRSSTKR